MTGRGPGGIAKKLVCARGCPHDLAVFVEQDQRLRQAFENCFGRVRAGVKQPPVRPQAC